QPTTTSPFPYTTLFRSLQKRDGYEVNQYAQRIISTPGKQDGLAWQNADGSWAGPIGEKIARAIEQGYSAGEPYHGYFFKILKGEDRKSTRLNSSHRTIS